MSNINTGIIDESIQIRSILKNTFSGKLDGKKCILEMKENELNWRQMEWPGWYVEEIGRMKLIQDMDGSMGPQFGRTKFDYKNNHIWDIKVHTINNSDGWCILNDREAIETVISEFGGIGFFIAIATVEYDNDGQFKIWHDKLKGKTSNYEIERINRGARSRTRKVSCEINEWVAFFIDDFNILTEGMSNGWVGKFQKGMRNANGNLRREKIKVNLNSLPSNLRI